MPIDDDHLTPLARMQLASMDVGLQVRDLQDTDRQVAGRPVHCYAIIAPTLVPHPDDHTRFDLGPGTILLDHALDGDKRAEALAFAVAVCIARPDWFRNSPDHQLALIAAPGPNHPPDRDEDLLASIEEVALNLLAKVNHTPASVNFEVVPAPPIP